MEPETLDFEIFFNQEEDYGEKKKFICTLTANLNDHVQNLKDNILSFLPQKINKNNVVFRFYNAEASYFPEFGISGTKPEPPNVELVTDTNYRLKEIITAIPKSTFDGIKLTPLSSPKILAYIP